MRDFYLRSPCDKVGGLFYFGRMLDQLRAYANGKLPPAHKANLGKDFDEKCVSFLRVKYDQIVAWVNAGLTDAEILQSCFAMGHRPSEDEVFMWNEFMRKRGWRDEASEMLKRRKREEGMTARSEIETMFQFLDADEGRVPADTNQYGGSCLEELSLIVGGRRR